MFSLFDTRRLPPLRWPVLGTIRDSLFGERAIAPPSLRPLQSDAIAAARVFCILGMVYAHAWTGRTTLFVIENSDSAQGMFRWVLVELIGRSSVPLLGMISGWLVASSALRRGYWNFVGGKARTILLPMILWNAIAVVLICGSGWMGWLRAPMPKDVGWVIDEIFGHASFHRLNVQMTFLRDLFICMALAPLFIRLRTHWLVLLMAVTLAWSIFAWWFPLFLRPQIPLFFLIGIVARRLGSADRIAIMPFAYAALPFAVLGPVKVAISIWGYHFSKENPELIAGLDVAMRFTAALLAWRTAIALAQTPLIIMLKRIEPYAFLLFCAHVIMIWFGGQSLGRAIGPLGTPDYPMLLLIQPLLVLAATVVLGRFLMEVAPGAAKLLSGGRLRADEHVRRALAPA
ncbi:MAG: acyltransferase [Sphingomonadaceae bacterium]